MWKKAILNLLCNIGVFVCLLGVYFGFEYNRYEFVLAGLFGGAIFIVLKIRLIKEIKNLTKKPKS
jgi:hypothetical protein